MSMVYGLWSLPYNITSIMARTRVKQPPRHRRPDLVALIALMGLASMIYILTTDTDDLPIDPAARAVEKNDIYRRGPHLRGLVADQSKEMDEFSVWVQENTDIRNELQRQRLLAILKTKWPECIDQNLTSIQCKALIDNEIQNTTLFTGADKAIAVEILHTRSEFDDNYNYVVIRTNAESGRTVGVWQDGYVYYDFAWNSTGIEADGEAQRQIPAWNGNAYINGSTIDEFLSVASEEGRRLAQIDRTKIIAGGNYFLNYTDSPTAAANLDSFLSTPKAVGAAGPRNLGPWNCKGLSGLSCCSKIKHSVRDADVHGKAIQCWIEPFTGTLLTKKLCEVDLTKICIYETHDGKVWRDPILSYDRILDEAVAAGREITKSFGVHE